MTKTSEKKMLRPDSSNEANSNKVDSMVSLSTMYASLKLFREVRSDPTSYNINAIKSFNVQRFNYYKDQAIKSFKELKDVSCSFTLNINKNCNFEHYSDKLFYVNLCQRPSVLKYCSMLFEGMNDNVNNLVPFGHILTAYLFYETTKESSSIKVHSLSSRINNLDQIIKHQLKQYYFTLIPLKLKRCYQSNQIINIYYNMCNNVVLFYSVSI